MTILGFFINRSKKLDVVESSGRCRWKEEAVVGRFKQESICEPSTGTSFIDPSCSVKKAVYWRSSFWRFHWPRIRLGQLKRKKEWPISSHLDRTSMVNNAYLNFSKTTKCTRRPLALRARLLLLLVPICLIYSILPSKSCYCLILNKNFIFKSIFSKNYLETGIA